MRDSRNVLLSRVETGLKMEFIDSGKVSVSSLKKAPYWEIGQELLKMVEVWFNGASVMNMVSVLEKYGATVTSFHEYR